MSSSVENAFDIFKIYFSNSEYEGKTCKQLFSVTKRSLPLVVLLADLDKTK